MIGIFGGTFDPIHFGHLRTAIEIRENLNLRKILFIPCARPPHRSEPSVSPQIRLKMLKLAIYDEPSFKVDSRELMRANPSYTVDTLNSLRTEMPQQTFALILGMDSFLGLPTWYHWRTLLDLAHIVVMERPGMSVDFAAPLDRIVENQRIDNVDDLDKARNGLILFQQVSQLEISATHIRTLINEGKNPRYLLPNSVWEIIQEYNLYRDLSQNV